nr:LysE family transporter [Pseudoclavibacter sp. 13-3]
MVSLTPGAGAISTMTNALNVGWRRSIWGILGQQVGLLVLLIIVASGLGALIAHAPGVTTVIRYAGAAYLGYLGVRQLLLARAVGRVAEDGVSDGGSAVGPDVADSADAAGVSRYLRPGAMVMRGTWVNLSNPKAIIFFLAFMPQFIDASKPVVLQYATVIVTMIVVDVGVMWGFFAPAARAVGRFARNAHGQRVMNAVFGALYLAVGVLLVFLH